MATPKITAMEVSFHADDLGEGQVEDRETVDLSDAEMDGESGGWDQPAAVSRRRDGALAIEP
jgi:hypothetical protein